MPTQIVMGLSDFLRNYWYFLAGGIAAGRWLRISPTGHPRLFARRAAVQGPDNPLGGC